MKFRLAFTLCAMMAATGCRAVLSHSADAGASAPNLMIQYGCPACHVISGVPGAVGKVGPSLDQLAQRSYVGGSLQNSPENLILWIQHPQHFHPGSAMPEMGVTTADARRIAMFLESRQ